MKKILTLLFFVPVLTQSQILSTVAGNGTAAFSGDGGPANVASIQDLRNVILDNVGNLYISDLGNYRIRKVSPLGIITTFAGGGGSIGDGGPATSAQLYQPIGMCIDKNGNFYIADSWNERIRKIDIGGTITTVAGDGTQAYGGDGGPATSAQLNTPYDMVVDTAGNIYIADWGNNRIRKIDHLTGYISTVAGTGVAGNSGDGGPAISAQIDHPTCLAIDVTGNIYIGDDGNSNIRKIDGSGIISTVAGIGGAGFSGDGGPAISAAFDGIRQLHFDKAGNLFVAENYNHCVRKIDAGGIVSTAAGIGASSSVSPDGSQAPFMLSYVIGVTTDSLGNIYVSEYGSNKIRYVCSTPDTVSGLITEPNTNPVNAGRVYVYRQTTSHSGLLDTAGYTAINPNGTYTFGSLPFGNYFIEAIPDTNLYTNAVGTYYSNKTDNYRWDSAIFVNHNACANSHFSGYDITVIEPAALTGTGTISGTVFADVGYGQRQGGNNTVLGAPLKGVDIKLGRNPGGCAARTTSDNSGHYTFSNLTNGNYFVYVDIPNFVDTIVVVTITSLNQNSVNNDYCVDSLKVKFCSGTTSVYHNHDNAFQMYPNPAVNTVYIEENTSFEVIITDVLGKVVMKEKNKKEIDLTNAPEGIYIVSVRTLKGVTSQKLVISR
ncbi:MAG: NHL domain-containing protein [Bacteroidia bacterium]